MRKEEKEERKRRERGGKEVRKEEKEEGKRREGGEKEERKRREGEERRWGFEEVILRHGRWQGEESDRTELLFSRGLMSGGCYLCCRTLAPTSCVILLRVRSSGRCGSFCCRRQTII